MSQEPLDPFSSNSIAKQNGRVLALFSSRHRKSKFIQIQKIFRRSILNDKYIRFNEKKGGGGVKVRCTLKEATFLKLLITYVWGNCVSRNGHKEATKFLDRSYIG